jgi:hypothetical protein
MPGTSFGDRCHNIWKGLLAAYADDKDKAAISLLNIFTMQYCQGHMHLPATEMYDPLVQLQNMHDIRELNFYLKDDCTIEVVALMLQSCYDKADCDTIKQTNIIGHVFTCGVCIDEMHASTKEAPAKYEQEFTKSLFISTQKSV